MAMTDAKTQGLPEMIAERIDDELVDMCHEVRPRAFRADCAALIRSELLGSELFKAAEALSNEISACIAECQKNLAAIPNALPEGATKAAAQVRLEMWREFSSRLRAALNELRNEGKNG